MNVVLKVKPLPDDAAVAHSVMAYDRSTDVLVSELPIPMFLDSLALKIAQVPAEDVYGAASYLLEAKQVDTFRFLLGLDVETQARHYFLEASQGVKPDFSKAKLEAVAALSHVSSLPRPRNWLTRRISESELIVPTLRLLEAKNGDWMTTSELVPSLSDLFGPSGADAEILAGRSDTYFSQKVRNMISHRHQTASFISQGMAEYSADQHGLRILDLGKSLVEALRS